MLETSKYQINGALGFSTNSLVKMRSQRTTSRKDYQDIDSFLRDYTLCFVLLIYHKYSNSNRFIILITSPKQNFELLGMITEITVNYTQVKQILRDLLKNPNWIPGFVAVCKAVRSAKRCITDYLNKQPRWRFPYQIIAAFIVVQHRRDIEILYRRKEYFGCGQVSKNKGKNDTPHWHLQSRSQTQTSAVWQCRVRDVNHLCNIIIPFFEKHNLLTSKHEELNVFKQLCFLLQSKYHLKSNRNYVHCLDLAKSIVRLRKESKLLNNYSFSGSVISNDKSINIEDIVLIYLQL